MPDQIEAPDNYTYLALFKIAKYTLQELERELARNPLVTCRPFHIKIRESLALLNSIALPK